MKKANHIKQIILFLLIFGMAVLYEQNNKESSQGIIPRGEPMEGEQEIELILNAEGLPKDYVYKLQVKEVLYTQSEADEFFQQAKAQIDCDFEKIDTVIPAKESYISGKVEAEWSFSPRGYVDTDFNIHEEKIPKEGVVINAVVTLTCGTYEELYTFAFLIEQKELTEEEQLITSLDKWFETEMQKEGSEKILLPEQMNGITLHWSEKGEYISLKVFCLGIVVLLLLYFREKEQQKEAKKLYLNSMEQDYPEIVGSLSVLLGAGMTLKQAWNIMAAQYIKKVKNDGYEKKAAFEEIVLVNRKIQEGAGEKEAFLQMMERVPLMCYHRLIRMLLVNRDNGTKGLCEMLDKEAEAAYEKRILNVRKLGEEASTKLLMPMMIMLFLVMAIVLLPAFINFSI